MTVLSFPSITPSSAEFGLISNTQSFVSPLAGTTQTLELPGSRWRCKVEFEALTDAQRRQLSAFLAQLRGQAGRFYYGDPGYKVAGPGGSAGGSPVVKGASQSGTSLMTDGWTANTGILQAGDYVSFDTDSGRELHMLVADVNSDTSGNATLPFATPMRTAPGDTATVTVAGANCIMRLVDNEQARWAVNRGPLFASVGIEMVEAFTDAA